MVFEPLNRRQIPVHPATFYMYFTCHSSEGVLTLQPVLLNNPLIV